MWISEILSVSPVLLFIIHILFSLESATIRLMNLQRMLNLAKLIVMKDSTRTLALGILNEWILERSSSSSMGSLTVRNLANSMFSSVCMVTIMVGIEMWRCIWMM
jgi:hypothetical protein